MYDDRKVKAFYAPHRLPIQIQFTVLKNKNVAPSFFFSNNNNDDDDKPQDLFMIHN